MNIYYNIYLKDYDLKNIKIKDLKPLLFYYIPLIFKKNSYLQKKITTKIY